MQNATYKIYNASAGSGKTYTLAKSYLKILFSAKHNDQFKYILALTFTNKAVAEMKTRIIKMLKLFSDYTDDTKQHPMFTDICEELKLTPKFLQQKSESILKNILHNYAAFDISTLDGFTHRIIRTFAHDLKLPVNFEVELDQERLLIEAVDSLISKAGTDTELTKILVAFAIEKADDDKSWDVSYDFNKIAKLLVNENHLLPISKLKEKTLTEFSNLKKQLIEEHKLLKQEIVEIAKKMLNSICCTGIEHEAFSGGKRASIPKYFIKLKTGDFTIDFDAAWAVNIADKPMYPKSATDSNKELIDSLQPDIIIAFYSTKALISQLKLKKALLKNITPLSVLHAIQNELDGIKNEKNKMLISEFNKIISSEIKNQPTPFIYERLGEKFKHYFIDEFQDTSRLQWENLIPLLDNTMSSTKGSLLLVGDAKQAIYRWRGGQAEQFINLYNNPNKPFQIKGEVLTLDTNFRSAKAVVNFNNSFFEYLGATSFNNPDHAKLYKNATQKQHSSTNGYVQLSFLDIDKDENRDDLFAQEVYAKINLALKNDFVLSDICILVRKRKEGVAIANYLSKKEIKITSNETLLLKNSEKIQFINNFFKLLTKPTEALLMVRCLKFIAKQHHIKDKHQFYTNHVKTNTEAFFESFKPLNINVNKSSLLQLNLYDLAEEIIRTFNINTQPDAYVQFYLDVVLEFSQKQNNNITAFIEYFEKNEHALSIVSPENSDAVSIMTIHKSKGLEFPVVIFPFADLDIYRENEPKVWYETNSETHEGFENILINYSKDIASFSEQGASIYNMRQSQLELDSNNLLYVALTRAEQQLYIISKKDINDKGEVSLKKHSGLFISYLKHIEKWDDTQLNYSFGVREKKEKNDTDKTETIALKCISNPKETHNLNIVSNKGLLWNTKQELAIERGNLIHLVLSKIKTIEDLDFALNELIILGNLTEENTEAIKTLVINVIKHPELKPYFSYKLDIYNERDIITETGQILRPDRLVINDKKEAVIIDYKTGSAKPYHNTQLNSYEETLKTMGFNVLHKYLVYINSKITVVKV